MTPLKTYNKRKRSLEDTKTLREVAAVGQKLLDIQVNRTERLKYTPMFVWMCAIWLLFVATVLVLQGFSIGEFHLESSVLVALVAGTSVSVIGFVAAIIKHLFSSNNPK